jgi:hypothetical protein
LACIVDRNRRGDSASRRGAGSIGLLLGILSQRGGSTSSGSRATDP